jgi:hypothetical protein
MNRLEKSQDKLEDKVFTSDRNDAYTRTLFCYVCRGREAECKVDAYLLRVGDDLCFWKSVIENDLLKYKKSLVDGKPYALTFGHLPQIIEDLRLSLCPHCHRTTYTIIEHNASTPLPVCGKCSGEKVK